MPPSGHLLLTSSSAFAYATLWLLFTPFIEEGHPLRKLFPPTEALLLPACLAISIVVAFISLHVGVLLIQDALTVPGRKSSSS